MTTTLRPSADIIELRHRIIVQQLPGAVLAELKARDGIESLEEVFDDDKSLGTAKIYAPKSPRQSGLPKTIISEFL